MAYDRYLAASIQRCPLTPSDALSHSPLVSSVWHTPFQSRFFRHLFNRHSKGETPRDTPMAWMLHPYLQPAPTQPSSPQPPCGCHAETTGPSDPLAPRCQRHLRPGTAGVAVPCLAGDFTHAHADLRETSLARRLQGLCLATQQGP